MSEAPRNFMHPKLGITAEQARDARARAWAFVFQCWDAKKGEHHDLITKATARTEGVNDRKGQDSHVRR